MTQRLSFVLLLLCSTAGVASGGGFGKLPVSARAVTLGGSLVTIQDDPNVLFSNPAGIGGLTSWSLSTSYAKLFHGISGDDLSYLSGSAVANFGAVGNVGVGITSFNSSAWKEGTLIGTYSQTVLEFLTVGASVKMLYWSASAPQGRLAVAEPLSLSKTTMSFDLGVQTKFVNILPDNDVIVGAAVQDLTRPSIAMDGSEDGRLDAAATIGVAYLSHALEYMVIAQYTSAGDLHRYALGVEIVATRGEIAGQEVGFVVRAGAAAAIKPVSQGDFFGGFGLTTGGLTLDYAFGQPTKIQGLAGTHHLTFRYSF